MGPLCNSTTLKRVVDHVEDARARGAQIEQFGPQEGLRRILVNACRAQMRVRKRVREIRLDATVDPAAPGSGLSERVSRPDCGRGDGPPI